MADDAIIYIVGGINVPGNNDCEHTNTEPIPDVQAKCTVNGSIGGTKCTECGTTITQPQTITALGHSFENGKCSVCGAEENNNDQENTCEHITFTNGACDECGAKHYLHFGDDSCVGTKYFIESDLVSIYNTTYFYCKDCNSNKSDTGGYLTQCVGCPDCGGNKTTYYCQTCDYQVDLTALEVLNHEKHESTDYLKCPKNGCGGILETKDD